MSVLMWSFDTSVQEKGKCLQFLLILPCVDESHGSYKEGDPRHSVLDRMFAFSKQPCHKPKDLGIFLGFYAVLYKKDATSVYYCGLISMSFNPVSLKRKGQIGNFKEVKGCRRFGYGSLWSFAFCFWPQRVFPHQCSSKKG